MKIIDIIEYDVANYKLPSMFIITSKCSFKCDKENGTKVCQNSELAKSKKIDMADEDIVNRYLSSPLSEAIVFGGLEPLDQFDELLNLISAFRLKTKDPIVIYTGYNEDEVASKIQRLAEYKKIIVKFGRFIPGHIRHHDDVLGVDLASDNQYAKEIKLLKVRLSDDKDLIAAIDKKLKDNKEQYGARYCPCSVKRSEDTICPCKNFREQSVPGPCHCGKFEKYE